jgi:hypothetical protein
VPHATLEEIQLRAMRALVSALTKKKYAAKGGTARRMSAAAAAIPSHLPEVAPTSPCEQGSAPAASAAPNGVHPRRRGRHIPAAVRRTVYERDGNCYTYVDSTGTRCGETHRLEFHHLKPFATGGEHSAANLTLRCGAHNALAAEEDFGRELILKKRSSRSHDAFGKARGLLPDGTPAASKKDVAQAASLVV